MNTSGHLPQRKSYSTNPIPLNYEQAEAVVKWLQAKYATEHRHPNLTDLENPMKIAYRAGQIAMIEDILVAAKKEHGVE